MATRLYRRILRVSRAWTGSAEEKEYILTEAHERFRAGQHLTDPAMIAAQLKEAEDRLELAVHYGIAFPRLHHKQQLVDHLYAPDTEHVGEVPHSRDNSVNAKLAAAAQRLKQARKRYHPYSAAACRRGAVRTRDGRKSGLQSRSERPINAVIKSLLGRTACGDAVL